MTKSVASTLLCAFTIISLVGYVPDAIGQAVSGKVYSVVEREPEFPGGKAGLSRYLAENIKFPGSLMRQRADTGPIVAQFIIDQTGLVHDVRVTSKPLAGKARKGMEAFITTVITAVEKMPRWQPGQINDRPVAVFYSLPVEVNVK